LIGGADRRKHDAFPGASVDQSECRWQRVCSTDRTALGDARRRLPSHGACSVLAMDVTAATIAAVARRRAASASRRPNHRGNYPSRRVFGHEGSHAVFGRRTPPGILSTLHGHPAEGVTRRSWRCG
jgi:hypothetical protein